MADAAARPCGVKTPTVGLILHRCTAPLFPLGIYEAKRHPFASSRQLLRHHRAGDALRRGPSGSPRGVVRGLGRIETPQRALGTFARSKVPFSPGFACRWFQCKPSMQVFPGRCAIPAQEPPITAAWQTPGPPPPSSARPRRWTGRSWRPPPRPARWLWRCPGRERRCRWQYLWPPAR